jgi:hypothetical protein
MELDPLPPRPLPARLPGSRSVAVAALLGWVVPGLGQIYVGRPLKALLFFLAVVPVFFGGLAMTGFTAVNPSKYGLEFAAQILAGGPTALSLQAFGDRVIDKLPRWFDVGRLYVAVGGLLNVVAISDALGEVLLRNQQLQRIHLRREARARRRAMTPPTGETPAGDGGTNGVVTPPVQPETLPPPPTPVPEEPR